MLLSPLSSPNSASSAALKRQNTGLILEEEIYMLEFKDLKINSQIGKGSFGRVFLGEYLGTDVAVKQIYRDENQKDELERFLERELEISKLSHPHIVQLIGLCYHDKYVYIVTEFVEGGDLRKHIKRAGDKMAWDLKVKIALDIAKAMAFLHSKNIIHRDMKTKNLLLDVAWKIKVCDFGFARKISADKQAFTICGTDEWMAPEVILGMTYGKNADVFSYGMVLTELITAKKIKDDFERTPQESFSLDVGKLRTLQLPGCPPELLDLAISCCEWNEALRPPFREILKKLQNIYVTFDHKQDYFHPIPVPSYSEELSPRGATLGETPMKWKKAMGGKSCIHLDVSALKTLSLFNRDEAEKAMVAVLNPTSYSGWLLLGYHGDKSLQLQGYGSGGLTELRDQFIYDQAQYALLRIDTGDKTTRDIFISWMGPHVPTIQKAIKKSHEGEVKQILKPFHAELYVSSKVNFTLKEVLLKSNPLSGSHMIDEN